MIQIIRTRLAVALFVGLFFLVFPDSIRAQVVINEFSSGSTADWVEVFNTATESADLSAYKLKDFTDSNDKVLSGLLAPGGFTFFTFSNYLNNTGDVVRLFKNEILVDSVNYGNQGGVCSTDDTQSIGRYPDGTGGFVRFSSQTQGSPNISSQAICPTPTPTPAPTPPPTPQPTPTKTPTPVPTKSPTPKPVKTPTTAPEILGEHVSDSPPPDIAFARDQLSTTAPGESASSSKKFPVLAIFIIVAGVGFIGYSVYSLLVGMKKGYTEKSETTDSEIL